MDPEKYNSSKPAWYSSIAMPLAEDVPVPSGDGPHGCLVMCGPSQVMSPNTPLDIEVSNPPGITPPSFQGTGAGAGSGSWTTPSAIPLPHYPGQFAGGAENAMNAVIAAQALGGCSTTYITTDNIAPPHPTAASRGILNKTVTPDPIAMAAPMQHRPGEFAGGEMAKDTATVFMDEVLETV